MSLACTLALLLAAAAAGTVAPEEAVVAPAGEVAPGGTTEPVSAPATGAEVGAATARPEVGAAADPEVGRPAAPTGPGVGRAAAPVGTGAVRPAFEPGLAHEVQRLRAAAELRGVGRFADAAAIYEELYDARPAAELLLAAARTRAAAGQHAHALAYLSQLVASGELTAAETQVAYGELQTAQRSVTPVTVRAQMPARSDDAAPRLRAEFLAQTPAEQRPPLEFPLPRGTGPTRAAIVQLDPGPWRVRVDEPGLAHIDVLVEVSERPGPALQLDLRPPADGLPQPQRRRLVGALVGLGGVTLAGGAGVTLGYEFTRLRPTLAGDCDDERFCNATLAAATTGRSVGTALTGAGVGVLLGGLTGLLKDPTRRRRAWIFELVLGGAGIAGGSFAVALAARGFEAESASPAAWGDPEHMRTLNLRAGQHSLAAAGLGLGSGLVFGAAAGLIRTRIYQQRQRQRQSLSLAPSLARGGFGLALAGRF